MFNRLFALAIIMASCLQLAACSSYSGPISNAPPPAGLVGLPLLTNHYAP